MLSFPTYGRYSTKNLYLNVLSMHYHHVINIVLKNEKINFSNKKKRFFFIPAFSNTLQSTSGSLFIGGDVDVNGSDE